MDTKQYIGITETSDPCFHLELFDNLYDGNIIITKRLTDKLIDKLVENKDKCILHMTVTGMGGTKIEPLVPDVETSFKRFMKLIESGFPIENVVLRIDPIVPTDKGWETAKHVLKIFGDSGIRRVRVSFLDMYNHVKERFGEEGIVLPYETFHAPLGKRREIFTEIQRIGCEKGFDVEACGEPGIESVPCLSQKDVDILGLTDRIVLQGSKEQRKSCSCPANKKELIKAKPSRCPNGCSYCYWKN